MKYLQLSEIIVFLSIFSVVLAVLVVYSIHRKKLEEYRGAIVESGQRYRALMQLNARYLFHSVRGKYSWCTRVDTRRKCENFDLDAYFESIILKEEKYLSEVVRQVKENESMYQMYQKESERLLAFPPSEEEAQELAIPYKHYCWIEEKLLNELIQHPVCSVTFECMVVYDSPAGRSHAENSRLYGPYSYREHKQRAIANQQRRESAEWQRQQERSKMNNALRYDIMKRDGFRCRLCGRNSDDGVKLHVDHIIPVSKGGRTVASNLRTLCEECNLGKRDKYDPYGNN